MALPEYWIQTYTGKVFDFLNPTPDMIDIEDIAHSLSNLCRYGGHTKRFYSVAEHSGHMSYMVPEKHALAALLHDASEAYLVDIPRPVKMCLSNYADIEHGLLTAISSRFGFQYPLHEVIKQADSAMLFIERKALLSPLADPDANASWGHGTTRADCGSFAYTPSVVGLYPEEAKKWFLDTFESLTIRRAEKLLYA